MARARLCVLGVLLLLLSAGCSTATRAPSFAAGSGKVKAAASFYPVFEFTRAVGGDRVDVVNMVPAGVEPHDWEPTPGHIRTLNAAQLFIYSGAGMEHWVPKTLASLDNQQLAVLEASAGFDLLKGADPEEESQWDPHVWLDPLGAVYEVSAIRDALTRIDPAGKQTYAANAAAYIGQLMALDGEFRAGLAGCARQAFYTTHSAFGYLAREYDLKQEPIMGLTPDAEPRPRDLARLIDEAEANHVQYIFFETLVSDKVARMVAREVGARTLVLNPLEGLTAAEVNAGQSYLSVMRANLANLKLAMECGKQ
jgi:zinc transport system substrate-binding protein